MITILIDLAVPKISKFSIGESLLHSIDQGNHELKVFGFKIFEKFSYMEKR